jgi:hypothetical protein
VFFRPGANHTARFKKVDVYASSCALFVRVSSVSKPVTSRALAFNLEHREICIHQCARESLFYSQVTGIRYNAGDHEGKGSRC